MYQFKLYFSVENFDQSYKLYQAFTLEWNFSRINQSLKCSN